MRFLYVIIALSIYHIVLIFHVRRALKNIMEAHIMHSHRTSRDSGFTTLLLACLSGIVVLFVSLLCTSHMALAASSHVDVMVLNYDVGTVSSRVLTRAID